MFEIEKDVPVTPALVGRPPKYPFASMEVGDSFAVPMEGVPDLYGGDRSTARLRTAASHRGTRDGRYFIVRADSANNVTRCWRTT